MMHEYHLESEVSGQVLCNHGSPYYPARLPPQLALLKGNLEGTVGGGGIWRVRAT